VFSGGVYPFGTIDRTKYVLPEDRHIIQSPTRSVSNKDRTMDNVQNYVC
jgi:hypothetical protein